MAWRGKKDGKRVISEEVGEEVKRKKKRETNEVASVSLRELNGTEEGSDLKQKRGGEDVSSTRRGEEKRKEGSGRTNEESDASVHHRPEQSFPVSVSFSVRVPEMRLVLSGL